jgi:hypothetical protein
MKVWITKYALTDGILEMPVQREDVSGGRVQAGFQWYKPREWHRTQEEAIAYAKKMQAGRIASLTKSLEKVKALDFGGAK